MIGISIPQMMQGASAGDFGKMAHPLGIVSAPAAEQSATNAVPPMGATQVAKDAKTELMQFCQRVCQRPTTKQDINYSSIKCGTQFQATVKLNCLQGQEYSGAFASNVKEAEKHAAMQALVAHQAEIAAVPPPGPKLKKPNRKAGGQAGMVFGSHEAGSFEQCENPAVTAKSRLNAVAMSIVRRPLEKGETQYTCLTVAGGYQATVALKALPGDWGIRSWAGHVHPTKQQAEQSAAEIALAQVVAAPDLAELAHAHRRKRSGKKTPWPPPEPKDPLPRERISDTKVTGEVVAWHKTYGWIKPHVALVHPETKERKGNVYVNKGDLQEGLAVLEMNAVVSFYVYRDAEGLGAEEVAPNGQVVSD